MIIVIDGYNVLKNIYHKVKGRLDTYRDRFIRQLAYYKEHKGHEIVVVFDGGPLRHATREVRRGVVVVFSGRSMSADDWIYDFVKRNREKEILLVTRDRSLKDKCANYGADALDSGEFYRLVEGTVLDEAAAELAAHEGEAQKLEQDDEITEIDSEALDILMAQADVGDYAKEDDYPDRRERESKAEKVKKSKRRRQKKLEKL